MKGKTLFERAEARGIAKRGFDGTPQGCVIGVYGDAFRPRFCGVEGSKLRCPDCWARTYRDAKKAAGTCKAVRA